jgi:hypothetical protein
VLVVGDGRPEHAAAAEHVEHLGAEVAVLGHAVARAARRARGGTGPRACATAPPRRSTGRVDEHHAQLARSEAERAQVQQRLEARDAAAAAPK